VAAPAADERASLLAGLFLPKLPRLAKPTSRLDVPYAGLPPVLGPFSRWRWEGCQAMRGRCRIQGERVRNDPTRATSKLWLEEAERVAAGLWVMTWIARQRGIDTASLTELMAQFKDVAAVLYDQMWPDLPVRDDSHETMGS
jgi:hypothetical protein